MTAIIYIFENTMKLCLINNHCFMVKFYAKKLFFLCVAESLGGLGNAL